VVRSTKPKSRTEPAPEIERGGRPKKVSAAVWSPQRSVSKMTERSDKNRRGEGTASLTGRQEGVGGGVATPSRKSNADFGDFCADGAGGSSFSVDDATGATCIAGQSARRSSGGRRYGSPGAATNKPPPAPGGTRIGSGGTGRACGRK
jgi:hypothetical protein